jgi:universal stress protein E
MKQDFRIDRVLVVVDDISLESGRSPPALIERAITLANATGCELELFHVCHDVSLEQRLFATDGELARQRQALADRAATRLAELAVRMRADGVSASHDVVWDHPRVAALLRRIEAFQPDLVMLESGRHRYVLGIASNDDWDLLRESPVPVWFVAATLRPIDRIVTGIASVAGADEFVAAADYDVFRIANHIGTLFHASNSPVHAYQVPKGLTAYAMYVPDLAVGQIKLPTEDRASAAVARRHGRSIRAFAEHFHIDPDSVRVEMGPPSDVLAAAARSLQAGLIVMGARNLSRWERAFGAVTAEPVLERAPCDVLFVKPAGDSDVAEVAPSPPRHGRPAIDLERAVLDPRRTFGSPQAIVTADELSVAMRRRLLRIWAQDVRAALNETNEGGPPLDVDASVLADIDAALAALDGRSSRAA